MKKIFTLFAAAFMAVTASAQFTWKAGDYEKEDLTVAGYVNTLGNVTFYGHAQASKGAYAKGSKTFADETTWEGRFKMGGTSTFTEDAGTCVFKFEAKKGQVIKVYAVHGSSSGDDRVVYVSKANNKEKENIVGQVATVAGAETPAVLTCTAPADGTYWVWEAGNVGIHAIVVEEPTALENVEATSVKAGKKMVNGKLVIEKDGVMYNVLGQKM